MHLVGDELDRAERVVGQRAVAGVHSAGRADLARGARALDARELREHRGERGADGVVREAVQRRVDRLQPHGLSTTFTHSSCLCLNVSKPFGASSSGRRGVTTKRGWWWPLTMWL